MEWRVLPFFTFVLCNGNEVATSYSLIYDHLSPNLNKRSKNKGYALAFFLKKRVRACSVQPIQKGIGGDLILS
jgi:hypothetical protein